MVASDDQLALLAINDIQSSGPPPTLFLFRAHYTPVLLSESLQFDESVQPAACAADAQPMGSPTRRTALLMTRSRGIAAFFIPDARKYFGDIAVAGVARARIRPRCAAPSAPGKAVDPHHRQEQQADCFAGVYLRWVAQGRSPRFTMNTTDGLDHVLAGGITLRDPVDEPGNAPGAHGSALDRVGAFQEGFDGDATTCGAIDKEEIARRRAGLPKRCRTTRPVTPIPAKCPSPKTRWRC